MGAAKCNPQIRKVFDISDNQKYKNPSHPSIRGMEGCYLRLPEFRHTMTFFSSTLLFSRSNFPISNPIIVDDVSNQDGCLPDTSTLDNK